MNKAELVVLVSEKVNLSKKAAEKAVDVLFEEMQTALEKGEAVKVSSFGVFSIKNRKQRVGFEQFQAYRGRRECHKRA